MLISAWSLLYAFPRRAGSMFRVLSWSVLTASRYGYVHCTGSSPHSGGLQQIRGQQSHGRPSQAFSGKAPGPVDRTSRRPLGESSNIFLTSLQLNPRKAGINISPLTPLPVSQSPSPQNQFSPPESNPGKHRGHLLIILRWPLWFGRRWKALVSPQRFRCSGSSLISSAAHHCQYNFFNSLLPTHVFQLTSRAIFCSLLVHRIGLPRHTFEPPLSRRHQRPYY